MTGMTRRRLPRAAAAFGIVASGLLALPALAGATGRGVERVEMERGEALALAGKCMFDNKPGKVIAVLALLHHKETMRSSFSAWADAGKDGSFRVAVKATKELTVEDTYVAGALCVSKSDHKKRKVVKESLRCVKSHPKHRSTTTTTEEETPGTTASTAPPTTEVSEEETPTETEVEKVVEKETTPKVETMPTAVEATPTFTG